MLVSPLSFHQVVVLNRICKCCFILCVVSFIMSIIALYAHVTWLYSMPCSMAIREIKGFFLLNKNKLSI